MSDRAAHHGRVRDPSAAYRQAASVVATDQPTAVEVLGALTVLKDIRADLDRVERELIGSARELKISWPQLAAALGLSSRQAAEQRWLRLGGGVSRDPVRVRAARRKQRAVDESYGPSLHVLRRAAVHAYRLIEADHGWDDRHSRAALARTSLQAAIVAPPSALYALCRNAIDDFDQMSTVRLPDPLGAAVRRLRHVERSARPNR